MTEDTQRNKPIVLTREELYRQVWDTPMSRLAVQYGITGTGLAKICDRLNIPCPPRGYWAKRAAGKKVVTYRLPSLEKDTPQRVTISPTPNPERRPELPTEIAAKVAKDPIAAASVTVPARLLRPHPIVAGWLAGHDRSKREARLEREPWIRRMIDPGEFSESDHRRHRILDALFKALDKQGGRAKGEHKGLLCVAIQGEQIEFQLYEKQRQVRRPLTDREGSLRSRDEKGWRQELEPTGRLIFKIKTHLPGQLRTEWLETDDTPLETLLPDIVATFPTAGQLLVEQRRQREEADRQRQIAEAERYKEQQRRKLDENRWRRFVELAARKRETDLARAFLEALKEAAPDPQVEVAGSTLAAWIAWAESWLDGRDPLSRGTDAIFREIAEVQPWSYQD